MTKAQDAYYQPTNEDIEDLMDNALQAAMYGKRPLEILERMDAPVVVYDQHTFYAFDGADQRFIITDGKGKIHWIHPDVSLRLMHLQVKDYEASMYNGHKDPNLTIREMAENYADEWVTALMRLKPRQSVADQIWEQVNNCPKFPTPTEAENYLTEIFREADVDTPLGWNICRIALGIQRSYNAHLSVDQCPLDRAAVLAQLLDKEKIKKPSAKEAKSALVAVKSTGFKQTEGWYKDVHLAAVAMAHELISNTSNASLTDLAIAHIERGDFDMAKYASRPVHPDCQPEVNAIEENLATFVFSQTSSISTHDKLRLMRAGNLRYKKLGMSKTVDPSKSEKFAKDAEIPF